MTLETDRFKNEGCICEWRMIADGPVGGKSLAFAVSVRRRKPGRIRTVGCAGRKVGAYRRVGWRLRGVRPAGGSGLFLYWSSIIPLLFLYFSRFFLAQRG